MFRRIREDGCYYVDKTACMRRLVDEGVHYFLSRPRRFGKSLFLDTLKELFEGSEDLFEGLAIYPHWDWATRYPVLRFDFARGDFGQPDYLCPNLAAQFDTMEEQACAASGYPDAPDRFAWLLGTLHERTGQRVVVLMNQYDKPILDVLDEPDTAAANRSFLRGLFGTIKNCDVHIKLTFLAGVAKFPR